MIPKYSMSALKGSQATWRIDPAAFHFSQQHLVTVLPGLTVNPMAQAILPFNNGYWCATPTGNNLWGKTIPKKVHRSEIKVGQAENEYLKLFGELNRASRMDSRTSLEFTVKGPLPVYIDDRLLGGSGCSILDLRLSTPSTLGEISFRNYYTASISVLVQTERPGATKRSGWLVAVSRKLLMDSPHLEDGSHDMFSISATESQVELYHVRQVRLILRQPSPLWRTFQVEEVSLYAELPRLSWAGRGSGTGPGVGAGPGGAGRLAGLVRRQTLASLLWNPPLASNGPSNGPAPYEIAKLPVS